MASDQWASGQAFHHVGHAAVDVDVLIGRRRCRRRRGRGPRTLGHRIDSGLGATMAIAAALVRLPFIQTELFPYIILANDRIVVSKRMHQDVIAGPIEGDRQRSILGTVARTRHDCLSPIADFAAHVRGDMLDRGDLHLLVVREEVHRCGSYSSYLLAA